MDSYTKSINKVLREYTESLKVEDNEEEIRDLDGFFSDEEVDYEDQEMLTKDQENAIAFASKLATKAEKEGLLGKNPQKEINKAYGSMMNKVAAKLKSIKI